MELCEDNFVFRYYCSILVYPPEACLILMRIWVRTMDAKYSNPHPIPSGTQGRVMEPPLLAKDI
jgi:hypothetical protein